MSTNETPDGLEALITSLVGDYAALDAKLGALYVERKTIETALRETLKTQDAIVELVAEHGPFVVQSSHTATGKHRYICADSRSGESKSWRGGTIQRKPAEQDAESYNRAWASNLLRIAARKSEVSS